MTHSASAAIILVSVAAAADDTRIVFNGRQIQGQTVPACENVPPDSLGVKQCQMIATLPDGGAFQSASNSGWTSSDGTTTSTSQRISATATASDGGIVFNFGPVINDGGIAGALSSYGPIIGRGRPVGSARGGVMGYAMIGSVDVSEGAVWTTQDGIPPDANNFALVGNGSSTEVNAGAQLFAGVCDHVGWTLGPLVSFCSGVPRMKILFSHQLLPVALGTCSATGFPGGGTLEGAHELDNTSGGNTGTMTRECVCTNAGDGGMAWANVLTGSIGTATTCVP